MQKLPPTQARKELPRIGTICTSSTVKCAYERVLHLAQCPRTRNQDVPLARSTGRSSNEAHQECPGLALQSPSDMAECCDRWRPAHVLRFLIGGAAAARRATVGRPRPKHGGACKKRQVSANNLREKILGSSPDLKVDGYRISRDGRTPGRSSNLDPLDTRRRRDGAHRLRITINLSGSLHGV